MQFKTIASLAGAVALGALLATGTAQAAGEKIGSNLGTLASPFWIAYDRYTKSFAKDMGIDLLTPINSEFDTAKQITDINTLINLGAQGFIFGPFDPVSAANVLKIAANKKVHVVAVDVAPAAGPVDMVVRADNKAYGDKACHYIGDHVASGDVVQIMGDAGSLNARERASAFRDCIKASYPKLNELEIPTKNWSSDDAAAGLDALLNAHPEHQGHLYACGWRVPSAYPADA